MKRYRIVQHEQFKYFHIQYLSGKQWRDLDSRKFTSLEDGMEAATEASRQDRMAGLGIEGYIPKVPNKTLIQAKVPTDVVEAVRDLMELRALTWNELIEACLRKFVDEMKRR
jgi:hypothetical protein